MDELLSHLLNAAPPSLIAGLGIIMWIDMRRSVKRIADSLDTLSLHLASVAERVNQHEKRIDRIERNEDSGG